MPNRLKFFIRYQINLLKTVGKNHETIFAEIYSQNLWGKAQDDQVFFSGSGTTNINNREYAAFLIDFIKSNKIKNVFEIGCGDFSIMHPLVNELSINYLGSDVVKGLVDHLNETYRSRTVRFMHLDAVKATQLPQANLCIIRQVFQHLSNKDILNILKKTKAYKYVLITEHVPMESSNPNTDLVPGPRIRLTYPEPSGVFLDIKPFSLNCKTLFSYRADHNDIPALMLTSLIEN